MWIRTYHSLCQGVAREALWRAWADVDHWPEWQKDLEDCRLEGAFAVGQHFALTPKGSKPVKILLTDIQEGYSFTDCTSFLGAKMMDSHSLEETPEGLKLTHTLIVTGPLGWLWVKLVAQHVADSIPEQMEALVQYARSTHG